MLVLVLLAGAVFAPVKSIKIQRYCDNVVAVTNSGLVCGEQNIFRLTAIASFKGIPYARQPLRELRFQELRSAIPWTGYLDASKEGPVCPQHDVFYGDIMEPQSMGEDCIHVNVHVPLKDLPEIDENGSRSARHLKSPYQTGAVGDPTETPLLQKANHTGIPILVFIHGGGFAFGSGDSDFHGPEYLVEKGVMVVTFNYRLGALGFLSLNTPSVPGNAGLRDILTLLRWVQRNAKHFGGNPNDVTLAGQSAGSVATHLLVLSKASEGLFHRAIMMSGTSVRGFFVPAPTYAAIMAKALTNLLMINSTDPEEIHQQLIDMPLERIMAVSQLMQNQNGLTSFYPVIESTFPGIIKVLDDDPEVLIKKGRGKHIPIITGFTSAECESFKSRFEEIDIIDRLNKNPILSVPAPLIFSKEPNQLLDLAESVAAKYFSDPPTIDEYVKYCTDSFFVYPTIIVAQSRAETGGAPLYLYQFSYQGQYRIFERYPEKFIGAAHAEDVAYLFKTNSQVGYPEDLLSKSTDKKMQDFLQMLVTNFMRYGNPVGQEQNPSSWLQVSKQSFQYLDLRGPTYTMANITDEQRGMVNFFNDLYKGS